MWSLAPCLQDIQRTVYKRCIRLRQQLETGSNQEIAIRRKLDYLLPVATRQEVIRKFQLGESCRGHVTDHTTAATLHGGGAR